MIGSATHTEIMDTSGYVEDLPHIIVGPEVMDEKVGGLVPAHPIELGPELSHGLCRKYVHLLERLLEDVREPVDEKAALLLVHFEPVGKGFLEGIGLHEVEDEEQPVGNRGKRMLLIDRMLAGTLARARKY